MIKRPFTYEPVYISSHKKDINDSAHSLFDRLLRDFFLEKLNIDLYRVPIDKNNFVGFEILRFSSTNKVQFVSTITKEVLFEVGLEVSDGGINTYYIEYWRDNK